MKHNILFLDDNENLTALVADYLERYGYVVDRAQTVAQATTLFSKRVYSMVLIDIRLSGNSLAGLDFACRLQEDSPWVPLMLFSACVSPDVEREAGRRRVRIVSKPKPLPELKAIIAGFLDEKYPRASVPPQRESTVDRCA